MKMKLVFLMIVIAVFCLPAKEVVDVMYYTEYMIDKNGDMAPNSEYKQEYIYDSEGLLMQTVDYLKIFKKSTAEIYKTEVGVFFKWIVADYDENENMVKQVTYNGNNEIISEGIYTTKLNSAKLIEEKKVDYYNYTNGNRELGSSNLYTYDYNNNKDVVFEMRYSESFNNEGDVINSFKYEYEYEYDESGNFCVFKLKYYNSSGELIQTSECERKYIVMNGKKLLLETDYGGVSKEVIEYNSKGLTASCAIYHFDETENDFMKSMEYVYEYTYKTVGPTAISQKQNSLVKNNFQINQNKNSLNLNFANNGEKRIEIINLQGKILKTENSFVKNTSIKISDLQKGVFVLRVFENGKVNSVKFVKE